MRFFSFSLAVALALAMGSAIAMPLDQIPFRSMDGSETTLHQYAGKVMLILNVASRCGNTPQYAALEKLYRDRMAQGFVILAFPCNDFGSQEPGTNEEIKEFCSGTYDVTFPIMDKIHVKGADQSPLYAALTGAGAKFPGDVRWNFGKFLIGRNGEVLSRFEPSVKPDSSEVTRAVDAALNNKGQ